MITRISVSPDAVEASYAECQSAAADLHSTLQDEEAFSGYKRTKVQTLAENHEINAQWLEHYKGSLSGTEEATPSECPCCGSSKTFENYGEIRCGECATLITTGPSFVDVLLGLREEIHSTKASIGICLTKLKALGIKKRQKKTKTATGIIFKSLPGLTFTIRIKVAGQTHLSKMQSEPAGNFLLELGLRSAGN